MKIQIPYGEGELALEVPQERCRVVEPPVRETLGPPLEAFRASLDDPLGCGRLKDLAAGRTVTYLLDDHTRAEPHADFMRAVLERLASARLVRCVLSTGCHSPRNEGNERLVAQFGDIASALGVPHEVHVHDGEDESAHVVIGETSRGTPVEADRRALDADVFLVTSDVKNHYFAGYSNPLKNFLPGICSFATTERNHSFALDAQSSFGRHPWHSDPERQVNPVAQDMLEAATQVISGRPVFVLASVITADGLVWSGAGEMEAVTRQAIARADRVGTVRVEPARYVVVSPGGDPQDETLYNAHRGLELSRNAVKEGGEILFLASCGAGMAGTAKAKEEFYDRLTAPLDEVIAGVEGRYVLYSHKAYKFARLIRSVRRITMVTELSDQEVAAAHLEKVVAPQEVIDRWLGESEEPILITTHANRTALYC